MKTHNAFPIVIALESLPTEGRVEAFDLSADARKDIAERLQILSIDSFKGQLHVLPVDKFFMLIASYEANVAQACVLTSEAVEETIGEKFEVRIEFGEEPDDLPLDEETLLEEEDVEYTPDGIVDVGDIIVQYLATALNPFPRKEGAGLEGISDQNIQLLSEEDDKDARNPFAVLKKLKDKG